MTSQWTTLRSISSYLHRKTPVAKKDRSISPEIWQFRYCSNLQDINELVIKDDSLAKCMGTLYTALKTNWQTVDTANDQQVFLLLGNWISYGWKCKLLNIIRYYLEMSSCWERCRIDVLLFLVTLTCPLVIISGNQTLHW